jgi:IMP dehydrogenase
MDSVSNVATCAEISALGGFGVLNLHGLQTRYEDPASAIEEINRASAGELTGVLRKVYAEPIKDELIVQRIKELIAAGATPAVSCLADTAGRLGPLVQAQGAKILVVQSPALNLGRDGRYSRSSDLSALCRALSIPVIIGNVVTFKAAEAFMAVGAAAILVGMGPGAASRSQVVLGVGLPQVTATVDCAAARDHYLKQTGRYVPVITDGGMRRSEDICKALACGSDAVMVGGLFARAREAPGRGSHWGMQTYHPELPQGTRIPAEPNGSLREIISGPALTDDGMQNLMGAISACMGLVGARTIREFHNAEIVIAPNMQRELNGKHVQFGAIGPA